MTEFENWWDKVLKMHWSHLDQGICYCAWRAALEWAKTQETDLQQTELGAAIREELNATSEKRC